MGVVRYVRWEGELTPEVEEVLSTLDFQARKGGELLVLLGGVEAVILQGDWLMTDVRQGERGFRLVVEGITHEEYLRRHTTYRDRRGRLVRATPWDGVLDDAVQAVASGWPVHKVGDKLFVELHGGYAQVLAPGQWLLRAPSPADEQEQELWAVSAGRFAEEYRTVDHLMLD